MTGRRFVFLLARGAIVALGLGLSFVGCSKQGEGERCDQIAAGNTDCEDGLVCVACTQLRTGVVDRCCPATPGAESDAACQRADVERPGEACGITGSSGGTTGSGGSNGASGSSGASGSGGAGGTGATSGQGGSSGTNGEGGAPDAAGAGGA